MAATSRFLALDERQDLFLYQNLSFNFSHYWIKNTKQKQNAALDAATSPFLKLNINIEVCVAALVAVICRLA